MFYDGNKVELVLHGALAAKLGRSEWEFYVSSPSEALLALEMATKGKFLEIMGEDLFAEYRLVIDGKDIEHIDEVAMQNGGPCKFEILPVLRGRGSNMGMWLAIIGLVIIGIVLAIPTAGASVPVAGKAAGAVSGWAALTTAATFTSTASLFLALGVTLALTGLSQMLAPKNDTSSSERPENTPSYIYSGPVNTYKQGNPVSVCFGVMLVGAQVVSAKIRNLDFVEGDEKFESSFIEEVVGATGARTTPITKSTLDIPETVDANEATGINYGSDRD